MPIGAAAVAVTYIYSIINPADGTVLGEIDLDNVRFSDVLSGVGDLTATLPLTHPKATPTYLRKREITVTRNGQVVWNGPITAVVADLETSTVNITAKQATWYLYKRTNETHENYSRDVFQIVQDLVTRALAKTGGGLYRFTVTAGDAGVSKNYEIIGDLRPYIGTLLEDLAKSPTSGFDFRLDVSGATVGATARLLKLAHPHFGTAVTGYVLEPGAGLVGLVASEDLERAGNRVHVVPGVNVAGTTVSLDNATSVAAGDRLLENVLSRSDLGPGDALNDAADEFRRLAQPPVTTYTAAYAPRAGLPYGWCDLGDLVHLRCQLGYFNVDDNRRVTQIETVPNRGGSPERVNLTLALPLDQLGV